LTNALTYGSTFIGSGQSRLLAIFAGLNVLMFLLIFFLVPETAGATLGEEEGSLNYISLEELNYIFGVSTYKHIDYQVRHVLPWVFQWVKYWYKRWVLWKRDVPKPDKPLEELYTWVRVKKEVTKKRRESEMLLSMDNENGAPAKSGATATEGRQSIELRTLDGE
jgi:hypothetical protein